MSRRLAVGKPNVASQLAAVHDPTEHSVRTAQQARRPGKVAIAQPLAHRGAAHAHAVENKRRDLLDAKAAGLARRRKLSMVPTALHP